MLNIWDGINPARLKDDWLLKEHGELHEVIRVLNDEENINLFPEAIKFFGKLGYLKRRHDLVAKEMTRREIGHHTPITLSEIPDDDEWTSETGRKSVEKMVQHLNKEKAFNNLEFPLTF